MSNRDDKLNKINDIVNDDLMAYITPTEQQTDKNNINASENKKDANKGIKKDNKGVSDAVIKGLAKGVDIALNGYKYKKEVTFEGCKNKRKLPFDFQVFLEDDSYCLIEIDGVFHYRPQYSEERFKEQKERDEIKNKFCRDNNIHLLRINYWRFREPYSYKQILKDFLDSLQQP